jgi:hypothetical protein
MGVIFRFRWAVARKLVHLHRPDAASDRLVEKPCFAWSADGFEFRSDVPTCREGAGVVGSHVL